MIFPSRLTFPWSRGEGVKLPPRPIFWLPFPNRIELSEMLWRLFLDMEIQDGGSQRRNTYISACIQHNWKIPTAKHMFSRLEIWITLFSILCNESGSQKSKMAANKPEILTSQPVYNITATFQKQFRCFQGCVPQIRLRRFGLCAHYKLLLSLTNSTKLFPILCNASGSRKSKMAASKEEILITQHVYNIVSN